MSNETFQDPMIGQTIAGYKILEKLGVGGMAVVYKAFHPTLERMAAIKFLPQPAAEEVAKRFLTEARAQMRLTDSKLSNIGLIYHLVESPPAIIMELLPGQHLEDYLAIFHNDLRKPEIRRQLLNLVIKVANTLGEAHAMQVLHRDLKPSNIQVTDVHSPDLKPVIMDWGLARIQHGASLTTASSGMGTPLYCAPEQIYDPENVDKRTDIFALGMIVFEILTGENFYASINREGAYKMVRDIMAFIQDRDKVRDRLAILPPAARAVVVRCIDPDRERRYKSMWNVVGALEALITYYDYKHEASKCKTAEVPAIADVPEEPKHDTEGQVKELSESAEPPRSSRKKLFIGAALTVIVALLVTTFFVWRSSRKEPEKSKQDMSFKTSASVEKLFDADVVVPKSTSDASVLPAKPGLSLEDVYKNLEKECLSSERGKQLGTVPNYLAYCVRLKIRDKAKIPVLEDQLKLLYKNDVRFCWSKRPKHERASESECTVHEKWIKTIRNEIWARDHKDWKPPPKKQPQKKSSSSRPKPRR